MLERCVLWGSRLLPPEFTPKDKAEKRTPRRTPKDMGALRVPAHLLLDIHRREAEYNGVVHDSCLAAARPTG